MAKKSSQELHTAAERGAFKVKIVESPDMQGAFTVELLKICMRCSEKRLGKSRVLKHIGVRTFVRVKIMENAHGSSRTRLEDKTAKSIEKLLQTDMVARFVNLTT